MASRTYEGSASSKTETPDETSQNGGLGGTVSDAAGTVRVAAGDAVARLPEVAASTRSAIEDANRQIRAGSDEMLSLGSVLSFGFAMGLLIGGASRLLVAAAMLPAAMMGLTLLDRASRARSLAQSLRDG